MTFALFLVIFFICCSSSESNHGKSSHNDNKSRYFILPRPTVYGGLQTQSAHPIYIGIIWNNHLDERGTFRFRERALASDVLTTIRPQWCDGVSFCWVDVVDRNNGEDVRMSFRHVKSDLRNDTVGIQIAGSLVDSCSSDAEDRDMNAPFWGQSEMSVYLYASVSHPDAKIWIVEKDSEFVIEGFDPDYGPFRLSTVASTTTPSPSFYLTNRTATPFYAANSDFENVLIHGVSDKNSPACCSPWNHRRVLPNGAFHPNPNIVMIQKILPTPFVWDIVLQNREHIVPVDIDTRLKERIASFEQRFEKSFPVAAAGPYSAFGMTVLSGLLSGLGWFEGEGYYKDAKGIVHPYPTPHQLLTLTPCKKGFPRGFYWDESWHELVVLRFDRELHETISQYWVGLANESTGWIAREQVIGKEALQMCPKWAWADSVKCMNPPSYYLTHEVYCDLHCSEPETREYFRGIFDGLEKTLQWYIEETRDWNVSESYLFHWNGRKGDGSYDSGLDDFPRAMGGLQPGEWNVDLQSWIAMATRAMGRISGLLGLKSRQEYWEGIYAKVWGSLSSRFWNFDAGVQFYSDVTTAGFVNHVGVVGLLPFCLVLEDNATRIERVFELITDMENGLGDVHGIMSLSKSDEWYFAGDGDYWRGNIWLNQQFICLRALKMYEKKYPKAKDVRKMYESAIAKTMVQNYERNGGGIYETYHPVTGKGYNHLPFTGWSSLILLILSEYY